MDTSPNGKNFNHGRVRKAKIVATLGPSSSTAGVIRKLMLNGVDVFRLNFSHGSHDEHRHLIETVREEARKLGTYVAVLQDLQGPKIRTGQMPRGEPLELIAGDELAIVQDSQRSFPIEITTTYPGLYDAVHPGGSILLDDGRMEVTVVSVSGKTVVCRVERGGFLGPNKGVNLPGADIKTPSLTEKDTRDLELGIELGVDLVALSFVRHPVDIKPLKEALRRHRIKVPIIVKLEKPEALQRLREIVRTCDGVMVARGDLGVEMPPEDVPIWQKRIISECNRQAKPAIVATQMLESMMENQRPTRAETSDVANAVLDGADALMLSGETAVGEYPLEAVSTMARVIERTEAGRSFTSVAPSERRTSAMSIAQAACAVADEISAQAIVVLTKSGSTARLVSNARPRTPVIALTRRERLARQSSLYWGIEARVLEFDSNTDTAVSEIKAGLLSAGLVRPRGLFVVVGSTPISSRGTTNFIEVQRAGT